MPVNIALLGSGLFATNAYLPALSTEGNKGLINLHTIWSRSDSSVSKLSTKATELGHSPRILSGADTLQQIWDDKDIDIVSLILPIPVQPDLIRAALKAGKHVISEKPVAVDVATAKALVDEYEREYKPKGLIWRVAENYEHDSLIRRAGEFIANEKSLGPVLYYQLSGETASIEGSSYQATTWRTVPDYQGGFILDGGVHLTSLLRTVLPPSARPATLIGSSTLHHAYLLPHDTVTGIALPNSSFSRTPAGTQKHLTTLVDAKIPGGIGVSKATGTILLTWALPNTPPETRPPQGLVVTTLNAVVHITNQNRIWTFKVIPGAGSNVKPIEETSPATGVENELQLIAEAVESVKAGGKPTNDFGNPNGPLWDMAAIEALLKSNGEKVEPEALIKG